jgi:hypothetical protein
MVASRTEVCDVVKELTESLIMQDAELAVSTIVK